MAKVPRDLLDQHLWLQRELQVEEVPAPRGGISARALAVINTERDLALERTIGPTVDFLPFYFLEQGARRGKAVVRVEVRRPGPDGIEVAGTGTGFLVAPHALMTNHHVLPDVTTARESVAQFRYELDSLGNELAADRWRLAPEKLFVTSPFEELDFTLVAVAPRGDEDAGSIYGRIPLRASPAKVKPGERVHIIQHPAGRRKEVVLHESKMTAFLEGGYLRYTADTLVGSSGAPVFNDQWDLVSLHHRGVIERDENGKPIFEDGDYVCKANEGIRISAIAEHLRSAAIPAETRALIESFLYP